jgi:tRNA 2-thiouridine synthesizing protein A
MAEKVTPDEILDCRGLSCPMPILRAKKTLAKMESGQILEIQSTDSGTKNDLPSIIMRAGHEYLGDSEDEGFTRLFIKVG